MSHGLPLAVVQSRGGLCMWVGKSSGSGGRHQLVDKALTD